MMMLRVIPNTACSDLLSHPHLQSLMYEPEIELCGGSLVQRRWSKVKPRKISPFWQRNSRFDYFEQGPGGKFKRLYNQKESKSIGVGGSDACYVKIFIGPQSGHCLALAVRQLPCWMLFKLFFRSCFMDFSKLLHGFVKVIFLALCQTKPSWSWTKIKAYALKKKSKSKSSMPWVRCAFGIV